MARMGTRADVARELGISRQAVGSQVKHRTRTGAPAPDDRGMFDVDAYRAWYLSWTPKGGPRRGIRATGEKLTRTDTV